MAMGMGGSGGTGAAGAKNSKTGEGFGGAKGFGGGKSGGGFGGGSGSRGTASQQQDRANRVNANRVGNVAPGVGMGSATDSRARNSRYNQNLIASGPLTAGNMLELSKMTPGPGMALRAGLGAAGITGALGGPQFEGVTPRSATGYSYDGPNRFAAGGAFRPQMPGAVTPNQARAQALGPAAPTSIPAWWRTPF